MIWPARQQGYSFFAQMEELNRRAEPVISVYAPRCRDL
ncbi:unnamed protein product [Acidithrix sp. C25]|nr:unnamed protein product [Acidithrix sp. C25]